MVNTTGLTYILIGGQEVKLKFGLPACQAFFNMCLDEKSEDYINGTKLTALGIAKIIHFGYTNACLIDDKEQVLTFGSFLQYTEDMIMDDPGGLENTVNVFSNSKYVTELSNRTTEVNNQLADEIAKKKQSTGILSKVSAFTNSGSHKKSSTVVRTGSSSSVSRGTNVQKPKKRKPKK